MTIEVRADRLVPTVEINIPKTHSRRISGVFAQREKGSKSKLHLLHRGLVNVFRGPIPKRTTLAAFADRVELCGDEGATIELIYVCAVSEQSTQVKKLHPSFENKYK